MVLIVDKTVDVISGGESAIQAVIVFFEPFGEIIGYTNVECS